MDRIMYVSSLLSSTCHGDLYFLISSVQRYDSQQQLKQKRKMVSFISTLSSSSLPSIPSASPTTTTTKLSSSTINPGIISCNLGMDHDKENRLCRRDVFQCLGAVISMDLLTRSCSFVEVANAADLIQRRQRSDFQSSIKNILATAIEGNKDLIPSILTLALNDSITYDKATKSGGPNGSIRFSSEIERPENKGLSAALSLLEDAKKQIDANSKGGPISYADLIQFGAQSAVKSTYLASAIRKCGGNAEKGRLLYTAYGSTGQWGLFDKQFGRSDAQEADPEGRVPQWGNASVQEMKDKFSSIGFGPRQLAVMSAFLGPDQATTEELLAKDPEVFPWVQKYQRSRETVSQTDYEVDLITTLTKLSSLGQQINYEAYSYPVQKLSLSKLKL